MSSEKENDSNHTVSNGSESARPGNWFIDQFQTRMDNLMEAANKRNNDRQIALESSKRYDDLKRALYQMTDSAFVEGSLTGNLKDFYITRIKNLDKQVLQELKSIEIDARDRPGPGPGYKRRRY